MLKTRGILLNGTNLRAFRRFATKSKKPAKADTSDFPAKILTRKHKTPSHLYLTSEHGADIMDKAMQPIIEKANYSTVVEINPGIGLLTQKLLQPSKPFENIVLLETMDHFLPKLLDLQQKHPERVRLQHADLINIWKIAYQDKMDNGKRVDEMMAFYPRQEYKEEPKVLICGAVGCYSFFKHLINSVVFQNSLFGFGRSDLILAMPPPIYIHLTCSNDIGYMIYRSSSMLFQMLFEYRYLAQVPRDYFLPTQSELKIQKSSKLKRVKSIHPDHLYVVKIRPRREILELCPPEHLPGLWYFVKQNCVSRRNRIIPNLEKWVPGCGPRLIINQRMNQPVEQLFPDEDVAKLPQYSVPCTTMSRYNYYPNMNIYTQFGDLNASEMLTLFNDFRSWPEYCESSFLASLENNLLKLEASADESIDTIAEEDDIGEIGELAEEELTELLPEPAVGEPKPAVEEPEQEEAATKKPKPKKTTRKKKNSAEVL